MASENRTVNLLSTIAAALLREISVAFAGWFKLSLKEFASLSA